MDNDTPIDTATSVKTPRRPGRKTSKRRWIRRAGLARRLNQPVEIHDGKPNRDVLVRNSVFRRLLLVSLISGATVEPIALLLVPVIAVIGKLSGLDDRDDYRLAKTTLDEAPSLFRFSTLLTLLVYLSGKVLLIAVEQPA